MKQTIAFLLLFFSLSSASAQRNRHVSVDLAPSLHGSGDFLGPLVNIEYGRFFKKRLQWTANIGSTIHTGKEEVLVTINGNTQDASLREITAGIQVGGQLWVAPVRSAAHELRVGLGPLVRYQASNASGGYSMYVISNPVPDVAFGFRHNEPMNVFTAGYQFGLSYAYTFRRGFLLGLKAGLQNDTNADIITHVGLRVGKRF